jgi:hypothetical protein
MKMETVRPIETSVEYYVTWRYSLWGNTTVICEHLKPESEEFQLLGIIIIIIIIIAGHAVA